MDGTMPETAISLEADALARLMPMNLCLSADGIVTSCGPTLGKVLSGSGPVGLAFFDLFEVSRPGGIATIADLVGLRGTRLHLRLHGDPAVTLRGLSVPRAGGGVVLNLSFGIEVADGVRRHDLTDADFAPTDLAMELLYLVEAKTAVMNELRDLNRRLEGAKTAAEEQALTDTLTGLRNRRALDMALSRLILRGESFGLMHMDLDFFKAVNDTLGHAAGDHVLCEVARVLCAQTRVGDTVARVGGDEFVILLPGPVDAPTLSTIAGRIIEQVTRPIPFGAETCRISASVGMVVSTSYAQLRPDRLSADADEALYEAKRAGRGRAVLRGRPADGGGTVTPSDPGR